MFLFNKWNGIPQTLFEMKKNVLIHTNIGINGDKMQETNHEISICSFIK